MHDMKYLVVYTYILYVENIAVLTCYVQEVLTAFSLFHLGLHSIAKMILATNNNTQNCGSIDIANNTVQYKT